MELSLELILGCRRAISFLVPSSQVKVVNGCEMVTSLLCLRFATWDHREMVCKFGSRCSVRGHFWAQSIKIQVFRSPTGYTLRCFGYLKINLKYNILISLKGSVIFPSCEL